MASWHEYAMGRLREQTERERLRRLKLDNDARETALAQRTRPDQRRDPLLRDTTGRA